MLKAAGKGCFIYRGLHDCLDPGIFVRKEYGNWIFLVSEQKPGRREVPMVPAWKGTWERSCLCRDSGAGAQVAERAGTCAPSVRMWLLMAAGVEG